MNWADYPSFSEIEFRCKHTGKSGMKPEFMAKLQALRNEYGSPMLITSGYRHPTHPVEAKKLHSNGEHTFGTCCDVACSTGGQKFNLVRLALKHGFNRIGVAKTFIHLGIGAPGLPSNVIWTYQ